MRWNDYVHDTASAIQKGAESAFHTLERGLEIYGVLQGGYQLAAQLGSGLRALAPLAPAAGVALL